MKYMRKTILTTVIAVSATLSSAAWAEKLPGEGITVQPLQSTIAEETFQTLIVNKAMQALGYTVQTTKEVSYNVAFTAIAAGDATYLANNWSPLHSDKFAAAGGNDKFYRKGEYVTGAGQGYLIDKKTADKYNISNIAQLKDPEIAKLFDANGDGTADLTGCNPGWGCEGVIEHQLDAFGLRQTVSHNQGNYAAIIADTITRYNKGDSIFYYTWVPYWVSGVMVPGTDVVWLEVPHSALPGDRKNVDTTLSNGKNYGFQMNTMRIVANKKFADANPAAAKLFELMKLSINDISAENVMMTKGANKPKDIDAHANGWIKAHQQQFDAWIETAKKAAIE
jgi:glycine betaine/proline transport system substrate-binding protein